MKEKKQKKPLFLKNCWIIFIIIFLIAIFIIEIIANPFFFRFPEKFYDREDVFRFTKEYEEDLNAAAKDMLTLYKNNDDRFILITGDSRNKCATIIPDSVKKIVRNFDVSGVYAGYSEGDNSYYTGFSFRPNPKKLRKRGDFYWDIFYSESGQLLYLGAGSSKELTKGDDFYFLEVPGSRINRIKHITGNWYYSEVEWYH